MNKKTFIVGPPDISIKFDGNGDLVLFLHGIGGNKNNWDKNLSYISKSFLCVACDIRGYGEIINNTYQNSDYSMQRFIAGYFYSFITLF